MDGTRRRLAIGAARSAWGAWFVALVGVTLATAGMHDVWLLWSMVGAAVVATLAGLAMAARRRRRLTSLEGFARRMLSADLRSAPDGAISSGTWGQSEFASLRATLTDLSARLRSELKEVAKKERNLAALIDALDEPVLATDNDRDVLLCNRSAESLFDVEPGSMIGLPLRSVFTQSKLLDMHEAARAGEVRREKIQLTTTLGPRTFQVSAAPVPVAWGEGTFGAVLVLRDVTELDRAMQMKSDFVANASHELRTPISAIRGAAETLAELGPDDGAMRDRLSAMIVSHAQRLEEMVRDLLDLSRLESPEAPTLSEAVDLEDLIAHLRPMFEGVCAERELSLSFELDPALGGVRTDGRLVHMVLRNLIENATRFAFAGTEVSVTLRLHAGGGPGGAGTGGASGGGSGGGSGGVAGVMRLEVTDRGIGIPIAQQDRVFERYYQVEPARTGTGSVAPRAARRGSGLGLSIVKHAVRALHGRVGVRSVLRQGSTFWVEVPVSLAPTSARATGGAGPDGGQPAGA